MSKECMTQMVLTKKSFVLAEEDVDLLCLKYIFFDTKGSELHP